MKTAQPLSLAPRKVVRFKGGKRSEHIVTPEPFDAERAQQIVATRPRFSDVSDNMSIAEQAYVLAVWDTIEDGSSSFMTAFNLIRNGKAPKAV